MSATCFVDTNVLVYFRDASEPVKQRRARQWLERLWRDGSGRISAQVLNELYVTLTVKLKPGLSQRAARDELRDLVLWRPIATDAALIETAWSVQDHFGLAWWDALIVAAAHVAGCRWLLTEDLQDGQDLDGVVVVNPFSHEPAAIIG